MVFVLEDDGFLHAYDSARAVERSIEALDAEETIRLAFDEDGNSFRIEWIRANRIGSGLVGFLSSAQNGRYRLVREQLANPGIADAIRGARGVTAESTGLSLDSIEEALLPITGNTKCAH